MNAKKALVVDNAVIATLTLLLIATAAEALATVPNVGTALHIAITTPSSPVVLIHINIARQEIQKNNTTAALAQLDMAAQAVSTASAQLSLIGHDLSIVANLVKDQNRIPTLDLLFGGDHVSNNNTITSTNESNAHSAMIGEVASYNALANIIVARQELQNGNVKGAIEELNTATHAISEFSQILLLMAGKIHSVNAEWLATG